MPRKSRKALANPTGLLPKEGEMTTAKKPRTAPKYIHNVLCTIDNPADEVLFDRAALAGDCVLRCPVCRDAFTHVQAVYTLLGGDESDGLYRGSHLVARETAYRRDALAVRVHGETCGHRWDLVFQQHQGQTLVRIDVLEANAARDERRY